MKTVNYTLSIFILLLIQACSGSRQLKTTGQYYGELPCADCPGIEYVLELNKDRTYTETSRYLDMEPGAFESSGTYKVLNDTIIHLENKPDYSGLKEFVVRKDQLVILDMEGNPMNTSLASWYVLKKGKPKLEPENPLNAIWSLNFFNDTAITLNEKTPFLHFHLNENRFEGFGGCNQLSGNMTQSEQTLRFKNIISTKKACPNISLENRFLQLLGDQSWDYQIRDNQLELINKKGEKILLVKKHMPRKLETDK